MLLRSARHGHRDGVDGTGTKISGSFDPAGAWFHLADLSPTLMLLSPHKYRVIKAAGAGYASTGGVSGALLGPMAGGLLADSYGLRPVFFITASVLILCFFVTLFCIREKIPAGQQKRCCIRGKW